MNLQPIPAPLRPTPVTPTQAPAPTPGLRAMELALRVSRVHHTLSMAQRLGIYPT